LKLGSIYKARAPSNVTQFWENSL